MGPKPPLIKGPRGAVPSAQKRTLSLGFVLTHGIQSSGSGTPPGLKVPSERVCITREPPSGTTCKLFPFNPGLYGLEINITFP